MGSKSATLLADPITDDELRRLLINAETYRGREGFLEIRPDLFTLTRRDLEVEVARLQLQNFRLALTLSSHR